ncbi:hypothetical protein BC941DRAFT_472151 [Chlamydoabsidia padenii]|nr:hypothetical protein BC941DRAFT_472151 [Chlamydoabsidia padenii]
MGQTTSSNQVDYIFGYVYDTSKDESSITTSYKLNKVDNHDDIYNTYIGERLLLYPQHYGLDNNLEFNDSTHDTSSRLEKRLSTPSTSSACSLSYHHDHLQAAYHIRISTLNQQQQQQQQQQQYIDRIDSGYADQDVFEQPVKPTLNQLHSRLAQDILYVDRQYYINTRTRQQRQMKHGLTTDFGMIDSTLDDSTLMDDDDVDYTIGTKLTFAAVALASQDFSMRDICLSRRSLISLSPNIGLLTGIRKLNLCNNQLVELPDSIGQLQQLEILLISRNQLRRLPNTIQYLTRLIELDLSYNQLQSITCLGNLSSLCTLQLAHNRLSSLPSDMAGMKRLVTMDLTRNPLPILPAEITQLSSLRRLKLDYCHNLLNYEEYHPLNINLAHDPPSLMEICARKVISSLSSSPSPTPTTTTINRLFTCKSKKKNKSLLLSTITTSKLARLSTRLLSYLCSVNTCSSCHGPYFESHVVRRRLVEKNNMWIPLEYHLCSAHWSDENDRILNMFHQASLPIHHTLTPALTTLNSLVMQQQQLIPTSTSLSMEMDKVESKSSSSSGKSTFIRHPQRLQRVMNNNPSSFLVQKLYRG